MQTFHIKSPSTLLAGAATTVGGTGALLALFDSGSPLRGPLALFFLLAAPATAIAVALRGLDPFGRAVIALAGAVVLNMLVAQGMLTMHHWSADGGVLAVSGLSLLLLLCSLARGKSSSRKQEQEPITDTKAV